MNLGKVVGIILINLSGLTVLAQTPVKDTVYTLKEIAIYSSRLDNFSAGIKITHTDSLTLNEHQNQNLADFLSDESPVFVKSYGLGALSTCSFRGASATQTAILWNGFNINSPMNGQFDLALTPLEFTDAVSVQYGGSSALWGSGAVGGTIHLTNTALFNRGISAKVNLTAGSFNTYTQAAAVEWSAKKFITSLKVLNANAKNNFRYTDVFSADDKKITQSNAELKNYGLLSESYWLINGYQKINLFLWYQHTDRNIPPIMLQAANHSKQIDNNLKITSEWKREKNRLRTYARAAYFNEVILYSEAPSLPVDSNRAQSFITEVESKISLNDRHALNIGLNNTFVQAVSSGYPNKPKQNRTAVFASYGFTTSNKKLNLSISLRQEAVKQALIPFTYSAGTSYQLLSWLGFQTNVAKVYRIPTFNELYWTPGGNPQLLPESGFSEEAGLNIHLKTNSDNIHFTTKPTVFNRSIKNWIVWLPAVNYWEPQNIMDVWSRGVETNSVLSYKIKSITINFTVLTNYVVSTNQQLKTDNDASVYKQLMYVPMYSGYAKIGLTYNNRFNIYYRHNYTGYRYTSTDNTEYLPPYHLGSCYLSYRQGFKNVGVNIFVQLNNIWNTHYQIIRSRAMPEINFNTGISFEFNKPTANN